MQKIKEVFQNCSGFIALFIFVASLIFLGIILGFDAGYKKCAKDFYDGQIAVELVEHNGGEKTWEWIKK